jgi:hypothetical protein
MMRPLGASHEAEVRPGPLAGLVTCRGNRLALVPRRIYPGHFLEIVCPDCERTFHVRAAEEVVPRALASA